MPFFRNFSTVLALALFSINIFGIIKPMDMRGDFKQPIRSAKKTLDSIDKAYTENGPSKRFLQDVNHFLKMGTAYEWPDGDIKVPLKENWFLWTFAFLDPLFVKLNLTKSPTPFSRFQFSAYDRTLRRGFGICSQLAILAADILTKRYGIPTYVVGLDGHVVAEARLGEEKYVLDPSFGVFLPFSIQHAELNLSDVSKLYRGHPIAKYYKAQGTVTSDAPAGSGYCKKMHLIETAAYILKWLIPTLLLLFSVLLYVRERLVAKRKI